jgi:hypothetical protein
MGNLIFTRPTRDVTLLNIHSTLPKADGSYVLAVKSSSCLSGWQMVTLIISDGDNLHVYK